AVLQPQDGAGFTVWNAIFKGRGVGLHRLKESGRTAVAVPINLRTNGQTESRGEGIMNRQLGSHPKRARIPGRGDFFRSDYVFEGSGEPLSLPFRDAVRQESPELERGVGFVGAVKHRLLQCHLVSCLVSKLAARTRNVIGVGKVPITVDHEESSGQLA